MSPQEHDYALPDRTPREDLLTTLLMAGVWLGFLAFPFAQIVTSGAGPWRIGLGVAGILAFCGVYLWAYARPRPLAALPRWANTLVYTAVLVLCTAAAVPTAGAGALVAATFVCALWLFCHPWRIALPAVGITLLVTAALTLVLARVPEDTFWVFVPVSFAVLCIGLVRFAVGREEHTRALREELALTRQQEALGREVHDLLGHSLTVISVKAQLARRLVHQDPARAEAELIALLALTRESIEQTRAVVARTAPLTLADQLAAVAAALTAAGVSVSLPPPETLAERDGAPGRAATADEAEDALFAACLREAVTNILRHAEAEAVTVTLGPGLLRVVDDGVGGAAEPSSHGRGLGLAGMRARAEAASATLTVADDRPGHPRPGTRVEVRR